MGEITTKLQRGRHASKGGVKGRRRSRRPPRNSEPRRDARLYRGCIQCECGRACADVVPSGTETKGCTELEESHCRRPDMSMRTPQLGM